MDQKTRTINWKFYHVVRNKPIYALISLAKRLLDHKHRMVICVDSDMYESTQSILWQMGIPHGTGMLPKELWPYNSIWVTDSIQENPSHADHLLTLNTWDSSFSYISYFSDDLDTLKNMYFVNNGVLFYEKKEGGWTKTIS